MKFAWLAAMIVALSMGSAMAAPPGKTVEFAQAWLCTVIPAMQLDDDQPFDRPKRGPPQLR